MLKKLKTRRGVTIAEMLVCVALLALLTAGGIAVAAGVMAGHSGMKEAANADILASTVIEAISNEVRLGSNIVDPTTAGTSEHLTLDSAVYGAKTNLKLDDPAGGHLIAETAGSDYKSLLSEDTYDGLHLADLTFGMVPASGGGSGPNRTVYTISFTVRNGAGTVLWSDSASAAPMRQW